MKQRRIGGTVLIGGLAAGLAGAAQAWNWQWQEFDEFDPIIEINATDGDVGFHVLLDGPGWKLAKLYDSEMDRMLRVRGTDDLVEQGITELFIESAEPRCNPEDAEDGEEVVTLADFIDRFEAGVYHARGVTIDHNGLKSSAEFTHNIPAAPLVEVEVEWIEDQGGLELEVDIELDTGVDLGRCAFQSLVDGGVIPHPADVEVVRWEVVVEPDEDQLEAINETREAMGDDPLAFGVFSAQLPGEANEMEVPDDWLEVYVEAGVSNFKYEVGAKEESGNQTFTEDEFDVYGDDD